jgi:hypothetical protein
LLPLNVLSLNFAFCGGTCSQTIFFFGQAHTIRRTTALVESGQDEQLWILRLSFDFFLAIRWIFHSIGAELYFREVVVGTQLMIEYRLVCLILWVFGADSRTGWVLILDLEKNAVQLVEGGRGGHF